MNTQQTYAVIDVGTLSTRLLIATVKPDGTLMEHHRASQITGLGEDVALTGQLKAKAIERTLSTIAGYLARIHEFSDSHETVHAVSITLTSAARDAKNANDLIAPIRRWGLNPQVISGDVEARLTFLGASQDFLDQNILVADIGGGSTELVSGHNNTHDNKLLAFDMVRSFDVGASRVRDLFFVPQPNQAQQDSATEASLQLYIDDTLDEARDWIGSQLSAFWNSDTYQIEQLIAVGGTATSLVAVSKQLEPYDSSQVHLESLSGAVVSDLIDELAAMTPQQREQIKGLQKGRASSILPGALILETILALSGLSQVTVSESDTLQGAVMHLWREDMGISSSIAWNAQPALLSHLAKNDFVR